MESFSDHWWIFEFLFIIYRKKGLARCGKCKKAFYCNVNCQVKHTKYTHEHSHTHTTQRKKLGKGTNKSNGGNAYMK